MPTAVVRPVPKPKEFSEEEVRRRASEGELLVIHSNKVYDLAAFADDHPGGRELLEQHKGRDITGIMGDPDSHQHSRVAYEMMQEHLVGFLAAGDCDEAMSDIRVASRQQEAMAKASFLDLKQPLVYQVWTKKGLTKREYLEQVHIGRHLEKQARLFHYGFLERLSYTPWWAIPLIWLPLSFMLGQSLVVDDGHTIAQLAAVMGMGVVVWTIFEYFFHRFLFHIDRLLPDNSTAMTAHFLLHGIHHFLPMDRERLVMPPVLAASLIGAVYLLARHVVMLPKSLLKGIFSGGILGYVAYDLLHYYSHHGVPVFWFLRWLKRYHLEHHYFHPERGFGVSSPLWDWVFGTGIVLRKRVL